MCVQVDGFEVGMRRGYAEWCVGWRMIDGWLRGLTLLVGRRRRRVLLWCRRQLEGTSIKVEQDVCIELPFEATHCRSCDSVEVSIPIAIDWHLSLYD